MVFIYKWNWKWLPICDIGLNDIKNVTKLTNQSENCFLHMCQSKTWSPGQWQFGQSISCAWCMNIILGRWQFKFNNSFCLWYWFRVPKAGTEYAKFKESTSSKVMSSVWCASCTWKFDFWLNGVDKEWAFSLLKATKRRRVTKFHFTHVFHNSLEKAWWDVNKYTPLHHSYSKNICFAPLPTTTAA